MATAFDLTTYPLSDRTSFINDKTVMRDILDDGNMRIRVLGGDTFRTINCIFKHMSEATSAAFEAYLITNRATEFTMTMPWSSSPIDIYTGYIFSDPSVTVVDGIWHVWSFQFRGKVS